VPWGARLSLPLLLGLRVYPDASEEAPGSLHLRARRAHLSEKASRSAWPPSRSHRARSRERHVPQYLGVILLDLSGPPGPGCVPGGPGDRKEQSRGPHNPGSPMRSRAASTRPIVPTRRPCLSDLRQPEVAYYNLATPTSGSQGAGSRGVVPCRLPAGADPHLRPLRPRPGIDARWEARPGQGVLPDARDLDPAPLCGGGPHRPEAAGGRTLNS